MVEIVVKPETLLLCSYELEKFLSQNGFMIKYRKKVKRWDDLSIELYEKSDKVTKRQLELQNIARDQMMGAIGSTAEIWGLFSEIDELEIKTYEKLTAIKKSFRTIQWKDGLTFHIEYKGEHSIYHFTYFHVPDPDVNSVERERLIWEKYCDEVGDF